MINDQFVILADESAHWKIAGRRQLERVLFSLDEFARSKREADRVDVAIFWKPDVPVATTPTNESRFRRIRLTECLSARGRILSTHLFLHRNALAEFVTAATPVFVDGYSHDSPPDWQDLSDQFTRTCADVPGPRRWEFVALPHQIAAAEVRFLQGMGKTQDGFVSRWINRPLARPITRLLLKLPIEPTTWTVAIFILPVLTCMFVWRGDYVSIVIGTAIYQLYSMLDGCDGEIARAKCLESKRGGRVDDLCDITGAILFVIALGVGLSRAHATWFYVAEGVSLAALIAVNEWALRIPAVEASAAATEVTTTTYPRHQRLIERAGLSGFGEKLIPFVVRATKRDVGILFFFLLATAGLPQWILHPWLLVTFATLSLSAISSRKARA